jgi:hypothetical protein
MKDQNDLINLLKNELNILESASKILEYSYSKCIKITDRKKYSDYTNEELDLYEALTSRFARLSDIIIQKLIKLFDEIELEDECTIRDRINRSEKKGIIDSAEKFIEIRILKNSIAHEYVMEALIDIFKKVIEYSPILLNTVEKIKHYSKKYI